MDRRQHSEQWNQMLEDALNTVLNSSNSSLIDLSNNSINPEPPHSISTVDTATSTTAAATTVPRTTLAPINTSANSAIPSMTNSSPSTVEPTISTNNNNNNNNNNNTDDELISKFTSDWFDCMYRYHMNVRQYHQNINQFNRLSSNIYNDLANQRRTNRINSLMESINRHQPASMLNIPVPPLGSATTPGTIPVNFNNPSTVPLFTNNPLSSMPISLQELLARSPPGQQIEIQGFTIPVTDGYEPDSTVRFPTIAQIYDATEIFTYNDDSSARVTDTRCPITLDDFEYGEELCEIKHCHHVFKWSSLRTWFSQNTHCPVCRHDIIEVDTRV